MIGDELRLMRTRSCQKRERLRISNAPRISHCVALLFAFSLVLSYKKVGLALLNLTLLMKRIGTITRYGEVLERREACFLYSHKRVIVISY